MQHALQRCTLQHTLLRRLRPPGLLGRKLRLRLEHLERRVFFVEFLSLQEVDKVGRPLVLDGDRILLDRFIDLLQFQLLVHLAYGEDRFKSSDINDGNRIVLQRFHILEHERVIISLLFLRRGGVHGKLAELADGLLPLIAEILFVLRDCLLVFFHGVAE